MEEDEKLSFVTLGVVTDGIVMRLLMSLARQADEKSAMEFLRLQEANTNAVQDRSGGIAVRK